jgi:serine/threonine protein kinase
MGCVYRARHLQLGKAFALKLISPAFALDSAARARFNQEAKLASEISHPNIVSIFDYGEDTAFGAYMVMELVEGEPLLAVGTLPMSLRRACDVLAQIADALDHIHRRGIVHGDVKADNIMMAAETNGARRRHTARLLDFGLARRAGGAHDGEISGSPQYLAPERAGGSPPSVQGDIYALGVLSYLLFTGTLPFDGGVVEVLMAHIHDPVAPMSERRGEPLDDAVEAMVRRALEKDPAQRHPSAAAFRYELNTVMEMLAMTRRRKSSGAVRTSAFRDATLVAAFERSRMPQALIAVDGTIAFANAAFTKLLNMSVVEGLDVTKTPLGTVLTGLGQELHEVHETGTSIERRVFVPRPGQRALDLEVWLCPLSLAGSEIHIMIRVEETH